LLSHLKAIENPVLNEPFAPGDGIVFTIGFVYPRPAKSTGVLPRWLFAMGETEIFGDCDRFKEKEISSNQ